MRDAMPAEMQDGLTDLLFEEWGIAQCVGRTVNSNEVSSQVEILLQSSLSCVIEDWVYRWCVQYALCTECTTYLFPSYSRTR